MTTQKKKLTQTLGSVKCGDSGTLLEEAISNGGSLLLSSAALIASAVARSSRSTARRFIGATPGEEEKCVTRTHCPPSAMPRLSEKACVVTGGGGGIGAAACRKFLEEGAKGVVVVDINQEAAEEIAKDLNEEFGSNKAVACKADVSKPDDVQRTVQTCIARFGQIDVYFANAGILGKFVPIAEESAASFERTMQVNTLGPFLAIKHASIAMKKTGGGSIILTSSIASIRADLTPLQYAASKGALLSLVISASDRLLLDNVRVNAVLPGGVMTNMVMGVAKDLDDQGLEMKGFDMKRYPHAEPEQIANIVTFLASEESSAIKGQCIVADGGMSNSMGSQPQPSLKKKSTDKSHL
jgi:NAD(P)-dependent dehydrogenase (short-subunit alcohol dehydrogenase family)